MKPTPSLAAVAKDLIDLKVKPTDSFASLRRRFFTIMRKHGVKQGTKIKGGGILCNNPDWQGAEDIFAARLRSAFEWAAICDEIPKDLQS